MPTSPKPWDLPYETRFAGRLPRVLVGFVNYGDISPECFESVTRWAFAAGSRYKGRYEIGFERASRREQYRARNGLVQMAQEMLCDFILMVDDDHTIHDCPGMIDDFYEERKPLQGGLYVQRRSDGFLQPVIQRYEESTGQCYWAKWGEFNADGGPVDVLGGGLNWIDMSIFDFMPEPFWWPYPYDAQTGRAVRNVAFYPQLRYGLDLQLCIAARKLGIQPWLNGKVKVGHVIAERQVIRPPGCNQDTVCEHCDGLAPWEPNQGRNVCPKCNQ